MSREEALRADSSARAVALDPVRSFCVTAPAGSGKTELLTQRLLALLTRVERPEQVLAITFTRKAAAEMRERLTEKLAEARINTPVEADHEQVTRDLALALLDHALDRGWTLDPEQFNVRTIDSLCADLTRQMPIVSALGGSVAVTDQHRPLFERAVAGLLARAEQNDATGEALRALLLHFDNDWQRVRKLLVQLLERRGDWGRRLGMHRTPAAAAQALAETVGDVTEQVLGQLCAAAGPLLVDWQWLANYACANLGLPEVSLEPDRRYITAWHWACGLLLTKGGDWRSPKGINKTMGFPPGSDEQKARLVALIEALRARGVEELLLECRRLPVPSDADAGWELVLHLSRLLPVLQAELLLVFQREGQVDHTHIALAAETALGPDDEPTDLALRLDYQIEHILIDEFQDTSDQQFRLLHQLTRGWAEHNASGAAPRTLFLVGDGMQSIYGFRYANVSLFLRARDQGVGGVTLTPLTLKRNFRSQSGIVDWVNSVFAQLLPPKDDLARGRVAHSEAAATHPALPGRAVEAHLFPDSGGMEEARYLASVIAEIKQREPEASVAVLVRARRHALPLIDALRAAAVPFTGRDLEPLRETSTIRELLVLCRWLANPADEVASLALLRAPWCGLTLADIQTLWPERRPVALRSALRQGIDAMSSPVARRLRPLLVALDWAVDHRDRLSLPIWIEQVWLRMGAERTLTEQEHSDALRFFELLRMAEQTGVGLDLDWLEQRLDSLFAEHGGEDHAVDIMTVHKSKGLQFDYVVMPMLQKGVAGNDRSLIRWHLHVDGQHYDEQQGSLLIAADDRQDAQAPSLYNYLSWLQSERDAAELRRLLYVGVTRARRRVWLSAEAPAEREWPCWPTANSPMGILRPAIESAAVFHDMPLDTQSNGHDAATSADAPPPLRRLPLEALVDAERDNTDSYGNRIPDTLYRTGNLVERAVGTAVHRALEYLSERSVLPDQADSAVERVIRLSLRAAGLGSESLPGACERAQRLIDQTLRDPTGRWLLGPNQQPRNEWPLWAQEGGVDGSAVLRVLDRSFVDAETNTRWIIDYKTSEPAGGESQSDFLAREAAHYREQLQGYRTLLAAMEERPIVTALYFPSIAVLHRVE